MASPKLDHPHEHAEEDFFGLTKTVANRVFFYHDVDAHSALEVSATLHDLSIKLRQSAILTGVEPAPIHLHIHSDGGAVDAALAIVDAIRQCAVPVHTHVDGSAASAATLVSVVGAHRTIGKHGLMLIHQLSGGMWGKFEEMKDELVNAEKMMSIIKAIYQENTKIPKKQLDGLLQRDLWLAASEALSFGLVDEVV